MPWWVCAFRKCPTHKAILRSCIRVGLQMKEMLAMIQHYATQDELLHANLLLLIKPGRFQDLMRRLNDKFCNIPLIVSAEEVFQISDGNNFGGNDKSFVLS